MFTNNDSYTTNDLISGCDSLLEIKHKDRHETKNIERTNAEQFFQKYENWFNDTVHYFLQ